MSKRGVFRCRAGATHCYKSGWELAFMRWLDASPLVDTWAYEPLTVEYVSSERANKIRRYIPDFLVGWADGSAELIEVKPSRRINKRVMLKAEAAASLAADTGCVFSLITEHELKQIGAL